MIDGAISGHDSNGPEPREKFNSRFLKDASWEEHRSYIFRTCVESNKLIWPFEQAYVGTVTYFGPGRPAIVKKWLNGPTFTYLRLTGKV